MTVTTDAIDFVGTLVAPRPWWFHLAHCRGVDPDLFYPSRGDSTGQAKTVCSQCPVQEECLEHALTDPVERFGVWGGKSERERRVLRRNRVAVS